MRRPPIVTEPVDRTSVGWKIGFAGSFFSSDLTGGVAFDCASALGGSVAGGAACAACAARRAAITVSISGLLQLLFVQASILFATARESGTLCLVRAETQSRRDAGADLDFCVSASLREISWVAASAGDDELLGTKDEDRPLARAALLQHQAKRFVSAGNCIGLRVEQAR